MVASANRIVERFADQEVRSYQMLASVRVYKGTFVGLSAGYVRPLVAGVVDAAYGAAEQGVISNNRTRIEEIETALQSIGLLA